MRIIQEPGEPFSISYDPDEKDLNVNGTVHGGIIFYLCDEAIGRYMTALGKKGAAADADIHFYRPAFPGNRITVTVTERKAGRRLGVYLIEAKNDQGKLIADSLFTIAFSEGTKEAQP